MRLRFVLFEHEVELGREVGLRDRIDVVDRFELCKRRHGVPRRRGNRVVASGRLVAMPVVLFGAADVRADLGNQLDEGVDPCIGDVVDRGRGALRSCHSPSLRP